jgi:hypothetical protein
MPTPSSRDAVWVQRRALVGGGPHPGRSPRSAARAPVGGRGALVADGQWRQRGPERPARAPDTGAQLIAEISQFFTSLRGVMLHTAYRLGLGMALDVSSRCPAAAPHSARPAGATSGRRASVGLLFAGMAAWSWFRGQAARATIAKVAASPPGPAATGPGPGPSTRGSGTPCVPPSPTAAAEPDREGPPPRPKGEVGPAGRWRRWIRQAYLRRQWVH